MLFALSFSNVRLPMKKTVAVLGGGVAGMSAAS